MNIWLYWDNKPGVTSPPPYIELCWESIRKHCEKDFQVNMVTTDNVRQFLPNISNDFFNIAQINNKSNFLRYTLLKEHGGIWLDSDLILFKSLKPLIDIPKDENVDLVATASPTLKYGEPECGFLLSTEGGEVISKAVAIIEYAMNLHPPGHIFKWGSLGPGTIRQAVKGKKYFHLDHMFLMPIPSWEAFKFAGREPVTNYCDEDSYGCMLFHEMFRQCNSPFLTMGRQQLLESPTILGQMFRMAGLK